MGQISLREAANRMVRVVGGYRKGLSLEELSHKNACSMIRRAVKRGTVTGGYVNNELYTVDEAQFTKYLERSSARYHPDLIENMRADTSFGGTNLFAAIAHTFFG